MEINMQKKTTSDGTGPSKLTDKSPYDRAVERIVREDDLINHRLSWLLTSQTIFLGTYVVLLTQLKNVPSNLPPLIIWLALVSCVLIYVSVLAAMFAIRHFRQPFPNTDVVGPLATHILGLLAPISIPLIFIGVWLSFLSVNITAIVIALALIGLLLATWILK
jgi:hypothetical protein